MLHLEYRLFPGGLRQALSAPFRLENLAQAPGEALLVAVAGVQKGCHEFRSQRQADNPPSQAQDVEIVVLDSLAGGIRVMTNARPHALELVRGNSGSDAAAANDDAALSFAVANGLGNRYGEVGVVVGWIVLVSTDVYRFVTRFRHLLDDRHLEVKAGVVSPDRNAHQAPIVT